MVREWQGIKSEVDNLLQIKFNQKTHDGVEISLIFCCDSSQELYGFCCYAVCVGSERPTCELIFAKAKPAPIKAKTLPTLELLASFLALKCMSTIISALSSKVVNVTICVDAQIVLSWILTSNVKTKNPFARNRVNDIASLRSQIKDQFNLACHFRYLPSASNPADLLTRGESFKGFLDTLHFWRYEPIFFQLPKVEWPAHELGCLSDSSKN